MKHLIKLICIIVLTLTLNSCATYHLSTLNHDPVYTVEGSDVQVDVINNEFELARLLRTDFRFRYDFAQFAMRQPITWHYQNRFFRNNTRYLGNVYGQYNRYYSYQNSFNMWNDWLWNYPHGYGMGWASNGWNNWGSPFGNNIGWNGYLSGYGYNGWHQTHPYMYGRRGSRGQNNSTVYSPNRRSIISNSIVDSNGSTSASRTYLQTLRNLSNANRTIQRTKPPRVQTPITPVVVPRPTINSNTRITKPNRTIRNNNIIIRNNSNSRTRINNSSSRPNSTVIPIRSSGSKTTTNSSRKGPGRK